MNVVVTGARGFVGRRLVAALAAAGDAVVGVDVGELDLTERAAARAWAEGRAASGVATDAIVHLAGRVATAGTADDPALFEDNLRLAEGAAELIAVLRPARLVHYSTMAVYPARDGTFSEDTPPGPGSNRDGLYGLAKLCAEGLLDFVTRDLPTEVTHLRIAQVFGPGMRPDRIIPLFISQLRRDGRLRVGGGGERVIPFIHVDDLVSVTSFFVRQGFPGGGYPGVYNVGTSDVSLGELARMVVEELGGEAAAGTAAAAEVEVLDDGPRERFLLDTRKLEGVLAAAGVDPFDGARGEELLRRHLRDPELVAYVEAATTQPRARA